MTPKKGKDGTKAIASESPALAPAVKPSKPGSASGFRVTACMIQPETPNAAPTSRAATLRDKRNS
ncbi:hypothetical protein FM106_14795 [Brachybacterium faecium]|nr:hypothetical protein FM106_14795 [Brachybacterium faecium]